MRKARPVESLQVPDLIESPVWEFINDDRLGETAVRPVKQLPAENLSCRLVGDHVRLANGTQAWALIGNVDVGNARSTEHFLTLSVERGGQWFTLARYHDVTVVDILTQAQEIVKSMRNRYPQWDAPPESQDVQPCLQAVQGVAAKARELLVWLDRPRPPANAEMIRSSQESLSRGEGEPVGDILARLNGGGSCSFMITPT